MAPVGYIVTTEAQTALTAAATRTILGWKSGAAFGLELQKWGVAFDGSTAGEGISVELMYCTWATNSPGTASTSVTPRQAYGLRITHGTTAARHWTTEPTVLSVIDEREVPPDGGLYEWEFSPGKAPDCAVAEGFAIRVTTAAGITPNYRAHLVGERV